MATNVLYKRRALRAFGVKSETSFGTDMSGTDTLISFDHQDKPMELKTKDMMDDKGDANGSFVSQRLVLASRHVDHSMKSRLVPSLVGLAAGCFADEYSVSGPTDSCYTHKFKLLTHGAAASNGMPNFISRNCHELHGNTIELIRGLVLNGINIKAERGVWADIEIPIMGGAAKGASGKTFANLATVHTPQPYMLYKDISFKKGTYTYSTEAFSAPTLLNTQLMSLDLGIKKVGESITDFASATQMVDRVDPISYEMMIKAKMALNAIADFYADYEAQTEYALQVAIIGSLAGVSTPYSITITYPKVRIKDAEADVDGEKLIRNVEFEVLGNVVGADDQSEFCNLEIVDKVPTYRA